MRGSRKFCQGWGSNFDNFLLLFSLVDEGGGEDPRTTGHHQSASKRH